MGEDRGVCFTHMFIVIVNGIVVGGGSVDAGSVIMVLINVTYQSVTHSIN